MLNIRFRDELPFLYCEHAHVETISILGATMCSGLVDSRMHMSIAVTYKKSIKPYKRTIHIKQAQGKL